MYYEGKGVSREPITGCTWLEIASRNGETANKAMQVCAGLLSSIEIAEVRRRATEWMAQHRENSGVWFSPGQ